MQILKLDGLCKQYPAFRLENVSFSMEAGTIMGLIGRNGAGKTTTLKSMLHLVHPDAGTDTICGLDMDKDEREIRSRIGFVSGGASYYQRKRLRELTDVTKRFYPGWDDGRYARLVRQFSLDESKRVCELSEGMKVKYQLAAAMSHRAELLILDEPTSGLDPVSRDELLDTFRTLCEQSILFSTHITSDLDACADTITYIQHGRVAASTDKKTWTWGYLLLQGSDAACTPALRAACIGARSHKGELEALLRKEDAALAAGFALTPANLEQIMVHLEREAEAHAPDLPGDRQHEAHREHRARERRRDQHCRRGHQPPAEQRDHGDRHRQLRAGRDAEDEGARDGVMKKRLQQIPRDRQSPAEDQRRQQPRQADLQQDPALRELSPALQDRPYF